MRGVWVGCDPARPPFFSARVLLSKSIWASKCLVWRTLGSQIALNN